ncbi:TPA: ATP-binding protein [Campylobacter coli]|nr:ATP-binding protein [Campylobacter coli]
MKHRDLTSKLKNYLKHEQNNNYIIYGKKKIGKTYFIKDFIKINEYQENSYINSLISTFEEIKKNIIEDQTNIIVIDELNKISKNKLKKILNLVNVYQDKKKFLLISTKKGKEVISKKIYKHKEIYLNHHFLEDTIKNLNNIDINNIVKYKNLNEFFEFQNHMSCISNELNKINLKEDIYKRFFYSMKYHIFHKQEEEIKINIAEVYFKYGIEAFKEIFNHFYENKIINNKLFAYEYYIESDFFNRNSNDIILFLDPDTCKILIKNNIITKELLIQTIKNTIQKIEKNEKLLCIYFDIYIDILNDFDYLDNNNEDIKEIFNIFLNIFIQTNTSKIIKLDEHRIKKIKEKFLLDFFKENENILFMFNKGILKACIQSNSLKDNKIVKVLKTMKYIEDDIGKIKLFFSNKHPKLNEILKSFRNKSRNQ